LFDRAITKEPHLATAWYNKIHSKSISRNDPDWFAIEKLSSEYCSYRDRLLTEFALGKAYMGIGDVLGALLHWTRGNRMKRNITTYDGAVEEKEDGYGGRLAASNLRNLRRGAALIGRANLYRDFDFGLSLGAA
jgi:hypothetical protein